MIKKIVFSLLFVCLCIAIPLAVMGYKKVELGRAGMALLNHTALELKDFSIQIPAIPQIPLFDSPSGILVVVDFLIKVVNGLSALINFIITILNLIIKCIAYLIVIIKNLITFKDSIQPLLV